MPVISKQNTQIEPLGLTRRLLAFDTINPPGNELPAANFLASMLEAAGFRVGLHEMASNRSSLIADFSGSSAALPLILSGHIDTVPLGTAPWIHDAFAGEVENGAIYGRGSSDMKAGLAAMACATIQFAKKGGAKRSIRMIFTAGEETGCLGARHLQKLSLLGEASGILIGEPTSNYPALGHKGALFARCRTIGVTAHSSMPHEGVNAIYKAARAIGKLEQFRFESKPHPLLGTPSLNVGMISGGLNVNSVPDRAEFTVDVRSVAGMDHGTILEQLQKEMGDDVEIERYVDLASVASDPAAPFVECAFSVMEGVLGTAIVPRALPFFTDGCVFSNTSACAIVILGPGEAEMAHKTDEYCRVDKIEEATESYSRILEKWCR